MHSSRNINKWATARLDMNLEECGAGGDCLFHVLGVALSRVLNQDAKMTDIRKLLADSVTLETMDTFVKDVGEDQQEKIFHGSLAVESLMIIQNKEERLCNLRNLIKTVGWSFPGTDVILRWFVTHCDELKSLNIGFVVFSTFGPGYTTVIGTESTTVYVLLFNHANAHWQLANVKGENGELFSSVSKEVVSALHPYL